MTQGFSRGRNGNGAGDVKMQMRERANKMQERAAEGRKGLVRGRRRSMRTSKFRMTEVGGRERVRSRARTRLSVVNREPRVYVRMARARCSIWVNDEYHFWDIDQYTYWSMLRAAAGCG